MVVGRRHLVDACTSGSTRELGAVVYSFDLDIASPGLWRVAWRAAVVVVIAEFAVWWSRILPTVRKLAELAFGSRPGLLSHFCVVQSCSALLD